MHVLRKGLNIHSILFTAAASGVLLYRVSTGSIVIPGQEMIYPEKTK